VDAFHDGEEVRFHRMDNVVREAEASGLMTRLLDDQELLLMSAEESTTFAVAEKGRELEEGDARGDAVH
jgi:hypothetical protein